MARFYLPYNFIPATGTIGGQTGPRHRYDFGDKQATPDGLAALARHDLWQRDRHHGRLICHIKLLTETVVGNRHLDTNPATVKPYLLDGQPAIPANSLRGMIASLMETLSQSALRVLDPEYRQVFADIDPE